MEHNVTTDVMHTEASLSSRVMRALVTRLALAVGLAMVVIGLGGAPAFAQENVAPTYLAPDDGASWSVGTAPIFRIRTFAGDAPSSLWLFVSKSPAPGYAPGGLSCGTIGYDVEIEQLEATTDPAVFEAKPKYFDYPTFWMNTPGTYYWQALRISYANGADGCIEGPVRSFTINAGPAPAVKKPLSTARARLTGDFDVTLRVTGSRNIDAKRGDKDHGTWSLTPRCRTGACSARLHFETLFGPSVTMRLARHGAVYSGTHAARLAQCRLKAVPGRLQVRLTVTKGSWLDDVWRVTRVKGTYRYTFPQTISGNVRCPAGWMTAAITGSLSQ